MSNMYITLETTESGDWQHLLIEGEKVLEGHSLRARDILSELEKHLPIAVFFDTIKDEY